MIEFTMPSLGADMADGTLTEWRVKPGDKVNRGDIIADVDTQKGLIEIEVFDEGTIDQLVIKEGEKVPVGTVMATIVPLGETAATKKEPAKPVEQVMKESQAKLVEQAMKEPTNNSHEQKISSPLTKEILEEKGIDVDRIVPVGETMTAVKEPTTKAHERKKISPLAKKMLEEKGIDIATIVGTGPDGSIVKKDIERAFETQKQPQEEEEEEEEEEGQKDRAELISKGIRSATASAMSKSNIEIPHFYLETKIDLSKSLKWLDEKNKQSELKDRLLPVVLLIKAVAKAIVEVPEVNAVWENGLQVKEAINIGFAVSLRKGGVVIPAIHNAEQKSPTEIMTLLTDLIPRAKALKLKSSELSESTITMTSMGEGDVDKVFGVIYPPQVAIIGFGSITEEVWAENNAISARPVIYVTLAADHRAIDGYLGSKFLSSIKKNLQNPTEL